MPRKMTPPRAEEILAESVSAEIAKQSASLARRVAEGHPIDADDIDRLDRLARIKALVDPGDGRRTRIVDLSLLSLTVLAVIGLAFIRLPSTSADLDVEATDVTLTLNGEPTELIPGELGEVLYLNGARISGATDVDPPTRMRDGLVQLDALTPTTPRLTADEAAVRLQEIALPSTGRVTVTVGLVYSLGSRGLRFDAIGKTPSVARLGEVIRLPAAPAGSVPYAIDPVGVSGKHLALQFFPVNPYSGLTVFRNIHVIGINFQNDGGSTILAGSAFIKSGAETGVPLQPGDNLTIKSSDAILLRELTFDGRKLKAVITAPHVTGLAIGAEAPRNLMPTIFDWIHSRWPGQLYAVISAFVALWLAARRWWASK